MPDERENLAEAVLGASRALVGIAVRGLEAVASDVTVAQHRVLLVIHEEGKLSVNDVAAVMGVNQSNASRHAGRLAELGLITREPAEHDARAVALSITPAGRARVQQVREARLREIRSVLTRMDVTDARRAAEALLAFSEAAGVSVAHEVPVTVP